MRSANLATPKKGKDPCAIIMICVVWKKGDIVEASD